MKARAYDVVFFDGPLPRPGEGPLTPEEQAFRDMLTRPREYSAWAQGVRGKWGGR